LARPDSGAGLRCRARFSCLASSPTPWRLAQ
jgi:hypothetical protein